ncbi:hypothetical protein MHYP_G00120530 [Metynnis hypsauchen]
MDWGVLLAPMKEVGPLMMPSAPAPVEHSHSSQEESCRWRGIGGFSFCRNIRQPGLVSTDAERSAEEKTDCVLREYIQMLLNIIARCRGNPPWITHI